MSKKAKALGLPIVNDRAAGIDIGSRIQVSAVPPELSNDLVQTFQSFTGDIERMADWLVSLGIKTVAMESTGLYWIPVYEILEDHGLAVVLANARDCKAVPGRKSDMNEQGRMPADCCVPASALRLLAKRWMVLNDELHELDAALARLTKKGSPKAALSVRRWPANRLHLVDSGW